MAAVDPALNHTAVISTMFSGLPIFLGYFFTNLFGLRGLAYTQKWWWWWYRPKITIHLPLQQQIVDSQRFMRPSRRLGGS
jgi:hypothetical protein